ncbi:hypothetical protein DSO57_1008511 [Entomophthora muscae]|uniref:Uncharacterized protein n=1 Tax=Entomophthora muscae TaxID=34485 RepID=A0ACC2TIA4_9FUNG|nr:hypothetical protein DSO57_1008511 [Entomophthora muscae]
MEFLLFHCHPDAQRLLASFWSFLNSEAGSLDQLPNVKQVSNCIQNFVHPAIHHLLGVQARHYMKVALVHRLDLSFAEVQNYAHQNQTQHVQTLQRLNTLLEQLNTQLPNIVGKILDLIGAFQTGYQDKPLHSELADTCSKLEALNKEFNDFSQTKQSELNRLKDLAHIAEAKIIKLKDNFLKYDNHLQMTLEEKLATLCKETEEALLLASQTPAAQITTMVVPEMDEI